MLYAERLELEPFGTPALVKIDHPPTIAVRSSARYKREDVIKKRVPLFEEVR